MAPGATIKAQPEPLPLVKPLNPIPVRPLNVKTRSSRNTQPSHFAAIKRLASEPCQARA